MESSKVGDKISKCQVPKPANVPAVREARGKGRKTSSEETVLPPFKQDKQFMKPSVDYSPLSINDDISCDYSPLSINDKTCERERESRRGREAITPEPPVFASDFVADVAKRATAALSWRRNFLHRNIQLPSRQKNPRRWFSPLGLTGLKLCFPTPLKAAPPCLKGEMSILPCPSAAENLLLGEGDLRALFGKWQAVEVFRLSFLKLFCRTKVGELERGLFFGVDPPTCLRGLNGFNGMAFGDDNKDGRRLLVLSRFPLLGFMRITCWFSLAHDLRNSFEKERSLEEQEDEENE
nr:hypothetical protein Iba_chr09dCG11880 [Ipomoea batatas]